MNVEGFKAASREKLSKLIPENYPNISYNSFQKILRSRDVKVNGKRVSEDIVASVGDDITFYFSKFSNPEFKIVYEDDNIIVVCKPRNIETEGVKGSLLEKLSDYLKVSLFAVHRLDRNTTGLIVFAKNTDAKKSLDFVFKERKIEKFYLALCLGAPQKKSGNLTAYLKKLENESRVLISDFPQNSYEKIETKYKILNFNENLSLLEVELVTGKTHQIRAHLAHIGCPILGDEKYGNSKVNREYKLRYQCLCSYKIIFHFEKGDFLSYLDSKVITLGSAEIDFLKLI